MKIGFIGLGIMGKPMAKHLLQAGYELYVYNRSEAAVEELVALGATACPDSRRVAEATDLVVTMLPDSPQVEEVALGASGILEGISRGKIVVDTSSIDPAVSRKVADALHERGAYYFDAPVSGGEIGAMEAKLAIMIGGPEDVYARVRPVLEKMGTSITRVGEVGAGNTVKLINQMIVAVNIAALSEGMAFARQAGLDLSLVHEAIRGGLAGSRVMETKMDALSRETYQPGFRVELHAKDLRNAVAAGRGIGADLSLTLPMLERLERLIEHGYGREDHSALYRTFRSGQ
ncbi:2-hydroxy-3-oxopropionate reductase [Paenibacillus sp. IB182496]|uniref:2-hydroxy-3-oxopropionate reductase n=1 Tax=Paenibacillus sabuli TaxID=2772509 RepID=A0A927BRC7_9BACL|nr:2-hydroxy-3-oxopropionate reductase [Paenibacillus sabuli]MBD2844134.1 2-hydroxy-3-oxopropionate reductase [Paenibacillus sabuli]